MEGGTGTGNGFYAQSEIYGGRYARAKIILISERKGGKVSQAGWLAGWLARWPCFGQGISSIIIIINARTRSAIAGSATPSPDPLCLLFPPPSSRTHAGDTHTRTYECYFQVLHKHSSLSLPLSLILRICTSRIRVYVYACCARVSIADPAIGLD